MSLRIYSLLFAACLTACASQQPVADKPLSSVVTPSPTSVDISISAFSTFMSEAGKRACQSLNQRKACIEDAITPEQFFLQLETLPYFKEVMASATGTDYQLLIANHASAVPLQNVLDSNNLWAVTEFSLLWRGLEIHSTRIAQQVSSHLSAAEIADGFFQEWWERVSQEQIFTLEYLYQAVGASDYITELRLPLKVGEFELTQTELSPDPFNGVLSRYRHPRFDDAFLDVAVYPIQEDLSVPPQALLQSVLAEEMNSAVRIAAQQHLELFVEAPFRVETSDGITLASQTLRADDAFAEPLFATSYAFIQQDKVVKISTNFPQTTSYSLVKTMIPSIRVPKESRLMKAIRQIVAQGTQSETRSN